MNTMQTGRGSSRMFYRMIDQGKIEQKEQRTQSSFWRAGSGGVAAIRRHLISVSAVLDARQEVLVVSAGGHPAADCLERFIRRMELTPLQPLALYAGRTTFGRVVLWLRPEVSKTRTRGTVVQQFFFRFHRNGSDNDTMRLSWAQVMVEKQFLERDLTIHTSSLSNFYYSCSFFI